MPPFYIREQSLADEPANKRTRLRDPRDRSRHHVIICICTTYFGLLDVFYWDHCWSTYFIVNFLGGLVLRLAHLSSLCLLNPAFWFARCSQKNDAEPIIIPMASDMDAIIISWGDKALIPLVFASSCVFKNRVQSSSIFWRMPPSCIRDIAT